MEEELAWLQGPESSSIGDRKTFPAFGNAKGLLPGTWRVWKTFPAWAQEKKQQQGHYAATFIMKQRQQEKSQQQEKHLLEHGGQKEHG
jgi:hypothetical protein